MATGDGTEFDIQITANSSAAVDAADAVRLLGDQTERASAAAIAAASAVKAAEGSYKASEIAADRAAKAHERISLAVDMQKAKMATISAEHGQFSVAAQKAADKLTQLVQRQQESSAKAAAASAAMAQEASALDRLKGAASNAVAAQTNLSKTMDHAKSAASDAAKAQEAAAGTGNLGKLSGALNQLGGPLGAIGGKATSAADAVDDLTETVGAAGPYIALAVAIVAISTAMLGAIAAATIWLVKMGGGMVRVEAISEKFKKNVDGLFQGPKLQAGIKKLLDGLEKLADLFSADSTTGKAMQTLIEDLGGSLLEFVSTLIPKVIAGFIQLEIWILKALIAIKPYGSSILTVVETLAVFGAVIVGVVVGALALAIGLITAGILTTMALAKAFVWAAEQVGGFAKTIVDTLSNVSLSDIGTSLITGLASGITGGAGAVVSAITGVVGGAISAAKSLLDSHSPSRVFADIGKNTSVGMAQGVEGGTPDVQDAMTSMVAPPSPETGGTISVERPQTAEPGNSTGATPGGNSANLAGATFNFYGVEGAKDAESRFRQMLNDAIEGDVAALGGAVPAT